MFKKKHMLETINFKKNKDTKIYLLKDILSIEEIKYLFKNGLYQDYIIEDKDEYVLTKNNEYLIKTNIKKIKEYDDFLYTDNFTINYKAKEAYIIDYVDNKMLVIHTKNKKNILKLKRQPEIYNYTEEKVFKKINKLIDKKYLVSYKEPYKKLTFEYEDGKVVTELFLGEKKYSEKELNEITQFYTDLIKYKYPNSLLSVEFEVEEYDLYDNHKDFYLKFYISIEGKEKTTVKLSEIVGLFKNEYNLTDIVVKQKKGEKIIIGKRLNEESFGDKHIYHYLFLKMENNKIINFSVLNETYHLENKRFSLYINKELKEDF